MRLIKRHAIARIYRTINVLSSVVYAKAATKLHTTRDWRY